MNGPYRLNVIVSFCCSPTKPLRVPVSLTEAVVLTWMLGGDVCWVLNVGLTGVMWTISEPGPVHGVGFGVGLVLLGSPVKSAVTCQAYTPAWVGVNGVVLAVQVWLGVPAAPPDN